MRVMTFNLRFENDRDGPNSWPLRRELVVDTIQRYAPSILGTQEGTCSQIEFLESRLPDYYLHTPGRVFDGTCQYPTLFFRKDRYTIRGGGEFWLSKTPAVHRSMDWDSAFPRMMSYGYIVLRSSGRTLVAAVTHLDHMGANARRHQAAMLAEWISAHKDPVILMGDFNDTPGSAVHGILTAASTGLSDTWQIMAGAEDSTSFTHHGFTGIPTKSRMDWILVSTHFTVSDVRIVHDRCGDRYPSDHFPYLAELELLY
jgi:endonuclease/exonuclease/phosphatase family metal-dependent hydrolase